MAELVDALDLGSSFSRSEGSSPFVRIINMMSIVFLYNGLRGLLVSVKRFVGCSSFLLWVHIWQSSRIDEGALCKLLKYQSF